MSKVKITGNASGTGTLTISAPNTNTDRTLTLPDGAGEILLSDGDGSNLTGITTGKVLQVVQGTNGTNNTTTSTSFGDTGLSASITPTSTSSKILVMLSAQYYIYDTSGARAAGGVRILRDSTVVYSDQVDSGGVLGMDHEYSGVSGMYTGGRYDMKYLDSPSTTSQVTYKTQAAVRFSGDILRFPLGMDIPEAFQTLILMEIGA